MSEDNIYYVLAEEDGTIIDKEFMPMVYADIDNAKYFSDVLRRPVKVIKVKLEPLEVVCIGCIRTYCGLCYGWNGTKRSSV